jgi:hypothetical protein
VLPACKEAALRLNRTMVLEGQRISILPSKCGVVAANSSKMDVEDDSGRQRQPTNQEKAARVSGDDGADSTAGEPKRKTRIRYFMN